MRRKSQLPLKKSPERILILDLHLIGDMVWLTPLLRAIRSKFPSAHIGLVCGTWGVDIIGKHSNLVDEFIFFNAPWAKKTKKYFNGLKDLFGVILYLRKSKWDLAIEVRGDFRQIFILWLTKAGALIGWDFTGGGPLLTDVMKDSHNFKHIIDHHKAIAVVLDAFQPCDAYVPFIALTEEERKNALNIVPYIGVHLGASNHLRQFELPEAISLIDTLISRNERPITIFNSSDFRYMDELVAIYKDYKAVNFWSGGLRQFVICLSRVKHLYCMDSAPAHIAAAFGAEVTVFFGPADSKLVHPVGTKINIIEDMELQCRPCNQDTCSRPRFKECLSGLPLKI